MCLTNYLLTSVANTKKEYRSKRNASRVCVKMELLSVINGWCWIIIRNKLLEN